MVPPSATLVFRATVVLVASLTSVIGGFQLGGEDVVRAVSDLGALVLAALASSSLAVLAWRASGRLRASFVALSAACASWAIGEAIWSWYELVLHRETPFPSAADIGFLLFPLGAGIALWVYPARGTDGDRRRGVLDALTVTAALGLISWSTALGAVANDRSADRLAFFVSLSYPVLDLAVLTLLIIVLSRALHDRRTLMFVGAGIGAIAVADSLFVYLSALGNYASGDLTGIGWIVGFVLIALAPAAEVSSAVERRHEPARTATPSKLPYVPVLFASIVIIVDIAVGEGLTYVDGMFIAVIVTLVLIRQYSMVSEHGRLVTALSDREDDLRHQAFHDPLTGLANRALFQDRLEHALDLHRRDLRGLAVLFCDLDDFKLVNDSLGHGAGDALLVQVADRLRGAMRTGDTLARLGGDEFAILLEDAADPWSFAGRLTDLTNSRYTIEGSAVPVTASVGLCVVDPASITPTVGALLAQADTAMYAAKRNGKGQFLTFEPGMQLVEIADVGVRLRLAEAIADEKVTLAYQPLVDLASNRLVGFEALARWCDEGVDVPPEVFIATAERVGLIATLTRSLLDSACAQIAAWDAMGARDDFTVAVNISPQQAVEKSFPDEVLAVLRRHGVAPHRLTLEITESALLADLGAAAEVTSRLRRSGINLSLDDFGVGYSSISHLRTIAFSSLKIDRGFIDGLGNDEGSTTLLRALLRFGHDLGIEVIAEGIERMEQLDLLKEFGCPLGQGYLLGRPAAPAAWTSHLFAVGPMGIPAPRAGAVEVLVHGPAA